VNFRLLALFAAVVGAFGAGWVANGWRLDANYQAETVDRERETAREIARLASLNDTLTATLAASDDAQQAKLRKAQNETNGYRECLANGTCGLRIATNCPAPQTPTGPWVDTGTGAELDPTARRAYFALRDGIDRASAQLAACQDQLRLRVPTP
jgi:hypothetical protein